MEQKIFNFYKKYNLAISYFILIYYFILINVKSVLFVFIEVLINENFNIIFIR
jgi:hypothetical protein